jgi:hypothetical protein
LPEFLCRKIRQARNQQKQVASRASSDQLVLNIEVVFASETSECLQTLWRDNPEGRTLHAHCRVYHNSTDFLLFFFNFIILLITLLRPALRSYGTVLTYTELLFFFCFFTFSIVRCFREYKHDVSETGSASVLR